MKEKLLDLWFLAKDIIRIKCRISLDWIRADIACFIFDHITHRNILTYKKMKRTKEYRNAESTAISINGGKPLDEMYYPDEYDYCLVVGTHYEGNLLVIELEVEEEE